jgi:hypothetical protein
VGNVKDPTRGINGLKKDWTRGLDEVKNRSGKCEGPKVEGTNSCLKSFLKKSTI